MELMEDALLLRRRHSGYPTPRSFIEQGQVERGAEGGIACSLFYLRHETRDPCAHKSGQPRTDLIVTASR